MDILRKDDIKKLMENKNDPNVSLFIPTHKEWNEMDQDITRYKNQLNKVEKKLEENGMRTKEIESFMQPAKDLIEDKDFWNHQSEGLAVYFNDKDFFTYKIPVKVDEFSFINNVFYVKPLLPLLSGNGRFFLLALDQKETKFYEGTKYTIREIEIPDVPTNIEDALQWDDPERSIQFHSNTAQSSAKAKDGDRAAIFHGQGAAGDDDIYKKNLEEFSYMIERGIRKIIHDETAPLIIASVDHLIPIYKKANSYSHLYKKHLAINPQDLSEDELHKKAYDIIKPEFEKERKEAFARYEQVSGNENASSDIEEIVKAANNKRIEYLWVNLDEKQWGRFDSDNQEVEFQDESNIHNKELLDFAAGHTLLNNGTVYALPKDEMPVPKPAIAIFRY